MAFFLKLKPADRATGYHGSSRIASRAFCSAQASCAGSAFSARAQSCRASWSRARRTRAASTSASSSSSTKRCSLSRVVTPSTLPAAGALLGALRRPADRGGRDGRPALVRVRGGRVRIQLPAQLAGPQLGEAVCDPAHGPRVIERGAEVPPALLVGRGVQELGEAQVTRQDDEPVSAADEQALAEVQADRVARLPRTSCLR